MWTQLWGLFSFLFLFSFLETHRVTCWLVWAVADNVKMCSNYERNAVARAMLLSLLFFLGLRLICSAKDDRNQEREKERKKEQSWLACSLLFFLYFLPHLFSFSLSLSSRSISVFRDRRRSTGGMELGVRVHICNCKAEAAVNRISGSPPPPHFSSEPDRVNYPTNR